MLALFVWAWSAVPVIARAATTRDSFVMRIGDPIWCRVFGQLECHSAPPHSEHVPKARVMPSDFRLPAVKLFDILSQKTGGKIGSRVRECKPACRRRAYRS